MGREGLDIKDVALRMAAIVDRFEERGQVLVGQHDASAAQLRGVAEQTASAVQSSADRALGDITASARDAVAKGIHGPLGSLETSLARSTDTVALASSRLEARLDALRRLQTGLAWKAVIACSVGSLLAIGAATYAVVHARREMLRSDWIGEINAAVEKGRLARCQDGGLCAVVGKRSYRLDR